MNSVKISGHLISDPQKYDNNGFKRATFILKVKKPNTENKFSYVDVCSDASKKGKDIEKIMTLMKGDSILVDGYLSVNTIKKDGVWKKYWSVVVQSFDKIST